MAVGAAPTILLIPSERLRALRGLLVAAGAPPGSVQVLDDAADLPDVHLPHVGATGPAARIVLDIDTFPAEDTGRLRGFCEAHEGIERVWVGADSRRHARLEREGLGGTLRPWPLTVDDLTDIAAPGAASSGGSELHRIAAILGRTELGRTELGRTELGRTELGRTELGRMSAGRGGRAATTERLAALDRIPSITRHRSAAGSDGSAAPASSDAGGPRLVPLWRQRAGRVPGAGPGAGRAPSSGSPARPDGRSDDAPAPRTAFLHSPAAGRRGPLPVRSPLADRTPPDPARAGDARHAGSGPAGPGPASAAPDEPLLSREEIEAFFAPTVELPEGLEPSVGAEPEATSGVATEPDLDSSAGSTAGGLASARPRWLKDQIADLADLVQGLDLAARRAHSHVGIEQELARLRQFTRTIGLVASPPPPRGDQRVDVATLVEEMLGSLAGTSPDAPRLLFRKRGGSAVVRTDKALLACALDAVLHTAIACSGSGDVVRVSVEAPDTPSQDGLPQEATNGAPEGLVCRIGFQSGPLEGRLPSDVLQPYALKEALPGIGANALAAAGAIAVGQGGDLLLERSPRGDWTFELSLPTD